MRLPAHARALEQLGDAKVEQNEPPVPHDAEVLWLPEACGQCVAGREVGATAMAMSEARARRARGVCGR